MKDSLTNRSTLGVAILSAGMSIGTVQAQSASLFLAPPRPPVRVNDQIAVEPQLADASFAAVPLPKPLREIEINDLISIVIDESATTNSQARLDTEKELEVESEISAFPRLNIRDLLNATIKPNVFGGDGGPKLGIEHQAEFETDGRYRRQDSMSDQIAARVVDIKPNGVLAIEARKSIQSDDELQVLVLTGYCRKEDLVRDEQNQNVHNTVKSSRVFDLRIERQHDGVLRSNAKKGFFTKALDFIFNF